MNSRGTYLSTWPTGEDLSGLKPQKTICDAVVNHIMDYDNDCADGKIMPRVIGIEGKWGSGKSNVIKMLEDNEKLKEQYYVLEFDAWSYQEDEYRISLMEHITALLKHIYPQKESDIEIELRQALSNYEYEETKFEPHVSNLLFCLLGTMAFTSLFGFILGICPQTEQIPMYKSIFIYGPWLLFVIICFFQKDNWNEILVLFENKIKDGATRRINYVRNPSVSNLRQWLTNVSEVCGKKLIVVIDNMDRLPNEKLKKLWSMIHVFANNEQMENVWIVIPYDEQQLKKVIGDDYKQYIRKTIPVTISVGEPIVSDVRDVFDGLYKKAFGETETNISYIRALFTYTNKRYSIRDVIYFLNSMVTICRQFPNFSLVSVALYVVLEEEIKENPFKVLMADVFAPKYSPFVPLTEDNRSEVAAIVYHISKVDAMQVVYENAIDHAVMGDDKLPIEEVKNKKDFYKVLTDYCTNVNEQLYEGYIDVLEEVGAKANEEYQEEINICWQHVIQFYLGYDPFYVPWVSYERMKRLLAHCNEEQKDDMLGRYSYDLFANRQTTGKDIYKYCLELDSLIDLYNGNRETLFGTISLQPSKFKEYIDEAKGQYKKFPVICNSEEWVKFCCNMIENAANNLQNLCYMRGDERFDFSLLSQKAEELIGENGKDERNSLYAYRIYRSLSDKPVKVKPARRIAVSDIINNFDPVDNDPVFIALQMYHNNRSIIDDELVPQIAKEIMYLVTPLEIFLKCFMERIKSYEKVAQYIIRHKMMCDVRLQANALDFSMPLVKMGVVTKKELEDYIQACFKDADERQLPAGPMISCM